MCVVSMVDNCCFVNYDWLTTLFYPGFYILGQRNRDYNYINDTQDTRLPLHNEDAFGHGIGFKCKVKTGYLLMLFLDLVFV